MSAPATDPDTGERHRIAVDVLADRLAWWLSGDFDHPPPAIAALPAGEQARIWEVVDRHAHQAGMAGMASLLAAARARNVANPTDGADL